MKGNMGDEFEGLSQKIVQKTRSIYNKCKNTGVKGFKNGISIIKNASAYKKLKENKKLTYKIIGGTVVSLSLVAVIGLNINNSYVAYNIQVNDKVLATVRSEEEFMDVLEEVKEEALVLYGQEAVLNEEPVFIKTRAKNEKITQRGEMIKNIKAQFDIKLKATAIKIDGKEVIFVKDDKIAAKILNSIKDSFSDEENVKYNSIDFVEKVEIVESATDFSNIIDEEEALQLIVTGSNEEKVHIMEDGDNTWTIALQYGLQMDDIIKANPGIDPRRMQIGQEISLIVPKPLISVRTKEYIELVEEIPFKTEYEKTSALYKGDKKIIAQGKEGEREIRGYLVRENGIEVDKDIIVEKVLKEPKTRVIAEGTKQRPATMATGTFANPTRGRLTSPFGIRWNRMHTGIDVAAPGGTPILAADAGKVSFAGLNGTYGNLVIIDHENGYQTYYAHNRKILVKKGDRVYKGQKIAEMGSTGRSTGTHLHFEVRKNGKPINPLGFVRY